MTNPPARHHPRGRFGHAPLSATRVIKQLLPVYDKPMVYYPLSTLMLAGIREVLLISTPQDIPRFEALLGDGSKWGIDISYCVQPSPDGLAQAFILGKRFVNGGPSSLVLGDNIFYGHDLHRMLASANDRTSGASVFAYHVHDPERYGVVAFDAQRRASSIEEKPAAPKSNYAVTGLYFYDADVCDIAARLNRLRVASSRSRTSTPAIAQGELSVEIRAAGSGARYRDTHSLSKPASSSPRWESGGPEGCLPEEIAFRSGWITPSNWRRWQSQCARTATATTSAVLKDRLY